MLTTIGLLLSASVGSTELADPSTSLMSRGSASLTQADVDASVRSIPEEHRWSVFQKGQRVGVYLSDLLLNKQLANAGRESLSQERLDEVIIPARIFAKSSILIRQIKNAVRKKEVGKRAQQLYLQQIDSFTIPKHRAAQLLTLNKSSESDIAFLESELGNGRNIAELARQINTAGVALREILSYQTKRTPSELLRALEEFEKPGAWTKVTIPHMPDNVYFLQYREDRPEVVRNFRQVKAPLMEQARAELEEDAWKKFLDRNIPKHDSLHEIELHNLVAEYYENHLDEYGHDLDTNEIALEIDKALAKQYLHYRLDEVTGLQLTQLAREYYMTNEEDFVCKQCFDVTIVFAAVDSETGQKLVQGIDTSEFKQLVEDTPSDARVQENKMVPLIDFEPEYQPILSALQIGEVSTGLFNMENRFVAVYRKDAFDAERKLPFELIQSDLELSLQAKRVKKLKNEVVAEYSSKDGDLNEEALFLLADRYHPDNWDSVLKSYQ